MRLIDAETLQLDYDWSEYDVDGQLVVNGYQAYSESQIENAPTINAIVIPKDATNGDVMQLIFPNAVVTQSSGLHHGFIFAPDIYMTFDKDTEDEETFEFGYFWWNEKYFKGNEEPKPMTREEMLNTIEDFCEERQDCKGCVLEKICDSYCGYSKLSDNELKQTITKMKGE